MFSENGFYGTSINQVAQKLGITKQALLHHFSTKEKLYAAVLERASEHLMGIVENSRCSEAAGVDQLSHFFHAISNAHGRSYQVIVLLMRELLDNPHRAKAAHKWYLRPFLDALTSMADSRP